MHHMKDQLNRTINIKHKPRKIISLVPSQTELLVELGLESSLFGVTKFCVHPSGLRKTKTIVGGTKQVNFDKIKALDPDIILCNKEENTKAMILELEQIAPVHISDVNNLSDALELIDMYGKLFSVEEKANRIVEYINIAHDDFSKTIAPQPKLKVAYFIWKDPWMVAADHTFIDAMLRLNNLENFFGDLKRYPEVDLHQVKGKLDVIMLSSEPYPFKDKHAAELKALFPNVAIQLVDGEYFSWYGSRLMKAFDYFKALRFKPSALIVLSLGYDV